MRIVIGLLALWLPAIASSQVISYTLVVTDLANTPVSTVHAGDAFKLRVFVADVRASPQGVFAAFVDVGFDAALASASGAIVHSATYADGTSGTSSPGLLDEVGGFGGVVPLGAGAFEVFEQTFTATAPGSLMFLSGRPDDLPAHYNLVFDSNEPVSPGDIADDAVALTIAEPPIFADGFEGGE